MDEMHEKQLYLSEEGFSLLSPEDDPQVCTAFLEEG